MDVAGQGEMSTYSTKKFRKLQALWNKKLEQSGFKDAERGRHRGTVVEDLSQRIYFHSRIVDNNVAYFDWAQSVTHTPRFKYGKFREDFFKNVWRRHAEGAKAAEIGREIGRDRWWTSDLLREMRDYFREKAPPRDAVISPAISSRDLTELQKENEELRWLLEKTRENLGRIARGKMVLVIACRAVARATLQSIDESTLIRRPEWSARKLRNS